MKEFGLFINGRWESAKVSPSRVAVRVSSRLLFLEAVKQGVGVGLLPIGMGNREPSLGILSPPIPALDLPLWVLTHADLRETARVRALMDHLIEAVVSEL